MKVRGWGEEWRCRDESVTRVWKWTVYTSVVHTASFYGPCKTWMTYSVISWSKGDKFSGSFLGLLYNYVLLHWLTIGQLNFTCNKKEGWLYPLDKKICGWHWLSHTPLWTLYYWRVKKYVVFACTTFFSSESIDTLSPFGPIEGPSGFPRFPANESLGRTS